MKNKTVLIKITKNYQVTLPAKLRKTFKLEEGDYLEAKVDNGEFIFRPKRIIDIDPSQAWFWDKKWQEEENKVDNEIKQGEMKTFTNIDDLIDDLNN